MDHPPARSAERNHTDTPGVVADDVAGPVAREELEEAALEGDLPVQVGTIRSALRYRDFRTTFLGMLGSTIGTWMQNVIVMAMAYDITRSAFFVGVVAFANFLPALFLSLIGGAVADHFDRKKLLVWLAVEQMLGSLWLAWIALDDDPSRVALLAAVAFIGTGAALQNPVFHSLTPSQVPPHEIQGVVSLNSMSVNASRVIGPAIGGLLYAWIGPSWVFLANAVSYVILMIALSRVTIPPVSRRDDEGAMARVLGGFGHLRHDAVARRAVTVVALFTSLCIAFITQMPVLADENLGIEARSTTYGAFYAMLGLGAVVGSLAIGTVLAGRALDRIVRVTFVGYAVSLSVLSLLRAPVPAFPVTFVVGFFYFATITCLATVFQRRLDNEIRGRGTAVWLMGVIGTAPVANLLGGALVSLTSITAVMLAGAAISVALAWFADLHPREQPGALVTDVAGA